MNKIFLYELKRLIVNKFFFLLSAVAAFYGYMILRDDIIIGVAYTAPFSSWSYGMYLARVLPLLLVTVLFFITFLYSHREKSVKQLTFAAPVNPLTYCLIKCAAMTAAYVILSLFVILISIVFYAGIFNFFDIDTFLPPIILTLVPGFLFTFGLGLLLGSIQVNTLYALMLIVLSLGFFPLPPFFDIYGVHLFGTLPLTLPIGPDGEPAFTLPVSFIAGKIFFCSAGLLMAFFGIKRYKKQ